MSHIFPNLVIPLKMRQHFFGLATLDSFNV